MPLPPSRPVVLQRWKAATLLASGSEPLKDNPKQLTPLAYLLSVLPVIFMLLVIDCEEHPDIFNSFPTPNDFLL